MNRIITKAIFKDVARSGCVMLLCVALVAPGIVVLAQETPKAPVKTTTPEQQPAATTAATEQADDEKDVKAPPEKLESLVAPIALYPDELLAQVLVASTYPLELIQLHQWLQKHPELAKDQKKLAEAVAKQPWDPSIQAMAPLGDTVKWLAEDIQWVSDLGNAFLAQQQDVMDAVQRLRKQAKEKGVLKSGEQMAVKDESVEGKEIIVIQQANPEVVYVHSYNPYSVWGAGYPYYPWPGIYYPPYYYGGAIAAGVIGFGFGLAIGAAWGGGWGWGCGWGVGVGFIRVNPLNNFNRIGGVGR